MAELESIQIEKSAVTFLKQIIVSHKRMDEFINEKDKEPSWDGMIYLYKKDGYKAEDILCRVPVQVKGENKPDKLKRKEISYPVKYKHLRNYDCDGGVVYFVVIISDDCTKHQIFYNCLTPIKLQHLLKGTEKKEPNKTKSIPMIQLKNNDVNNLYSILAQFDVDSKTQGNSRGHIMKHIIDSKKIKDIDSVLCKAYVSNYGEVIEKINMGEICLYGHDIVNDTWCPFAYEEQKRVELITSIELNKPFGVDKQFFYESVILESRKGEKLVRLSENLLINDTKKVYIFHPVSKLNIIENDILFIKALKFGKEISIGQDCSLSLGSITFKEEFLKYLSWLENLIAAFKEYDIICEKRLDQFTDKDFDAVNCLIGIYLKNISKNYKSNWWLMWWENKVYPIFITEDTNGKRKAYNLLASSKLWISAEVNGKHYIVPNFYMYKREVWKKIYDFNESVVLAQLQRCDYNLYVGDIYYALFVELLSAYDYSKNEKLYNIAKYISEKFEEMNSQDQNGIINKMQLIKRKRKLSDAEIVILEKIEQIPYNDMTYCAVEILLENKHNARKKIESLSVQDKEIFKSYPIFNLLEN